MKKIIFLALFFLSSQSLYAQSDLGMDLDLEIEMDQTIDVSGTYNGKQRLSAADKMKIFRKRLEKRNELMVKKKIETIRYKKEVEMMRKLRAVFNQQMKALENI
jgi:hypothetical protein